MCVTPYPAVVPPTRSWGSLPTRDSTQCHKGCHTPMWAPGLACLHSIHTRPRTSKPLGLGRKKARRFWGSRYPRRGSCRAQVPEARPLWLGRGRGPGSTESKGAALGAPGRMGRRLAGGTILGQRPQTGWGWGPAPRGWRRPVGQTGRDRPGRWEWSVEEVAGWQPPSPPSSAICSAGAGRLRGCGLCAPPLPGGAALFPRRAGPVGRLCPILRSCRWLGRSFGCLSAHGGGP